MEPLDFIKTFLQFLAEPPEDRAERARELERHLDRLAWIRHDLSYEFDDREMPDPPQRSYDQTRAVLADRFPEMEWYYTVSKVRREEGEGEAEVQYGDALDDLTDIQEDLTACLWRWENNGRSDALFHLETLMPHWMGHVRGLQRFLGDWLW